MASGAGDVDFLCGCGPWHVVRAPVGYLILPHLSSSNGTQGFIKTKTGWETEKGYYWRRGFPGDTIKIHCIHVFNCYRVNTVI